MRLHLLRGLLLCLAASVAGAQNVKLELKPNAAVTEFWVRTIEKSQRAGFVTTPEAGADDWHEVDTLELVRLRSTTGEGGFLEFTAEPLGKSVRINARKVEVPDNREPIFYRISPRNEMPDAMALGDIAAGLAPTFPESPVPVGHEWTAKVAATEQMPHAYDVKHKLLAVEDFQGEKVGVIVSEGSLVTKEPDLAFNLSVGAQTKVGLTSGMVLRSTSVIVFNVQALKRFKDGHKIQRRQVQRIVERRLPGDGQGPGK